ncbi:ABC transporter permease [Paracoccus methylarcula]|uniref:ABC transporter permease n=2 Tax=Paracoccus methylarcula TaxID=72022 RepID=A0A422R0V9_9RHOB|nr:ABC transporter permease [Paracoccus methylarcula]
MTPVPSDEPTASPQDTGKRGKWRDGEIYQSFRRRPATIGAAILLLFLIATAFLSPLFVPQNPYDAAQLDLLNAEIPPIWQADGQWPFILGTDTQGRDVLSAILYGSRVSIVIGVAAVLLSLIVGITFGLLAGYYGGIIDTLLMRLGDVLLSIPTILVAILVSSLARQALPASLRDVGAAGVLVLAIVLSSWVQYARTVRAQASVEREKEYVLAARVLHVPNRRIMLGHILPNTLTPIFVAATLNFGMAILTEATLSFLGIGMPPGQPSLGTLIRLGNDYLFSGSWWIVVFPVMQLSFLVVTVNMIGDWLRDALNPKLR